MSGSPGAATADAPPGGLRGWWRNRPVRPRRGGKVSGVSAAVGLRYGIDPIIIRIAFVVATVYGNAGILLYLVCWLLFPKADGRGGARPTTWPVAMVLVLLMVPSVFVISPKYGAAGLLLGLGGFYLLHRKYPDPAAFRMPPTAPVDENTWVFPGTPGTWAASADSATAATTGTALEPPGTEVGAAELPDPGPDAAASRSKRWISFAAVGLALIAAGGAVFDGADVATVLAVALGVLGAGMIVASFAGGGRGLLWLAIPLAALAIVMNTIPANGKWPTSGNLIVHPDDPAAVLPRYELSTGDITLDLTSLRLDDDERVRSAVRVREGSVVVRVPDDVDLAAKCSVDSGRVRCGGEGTGRGLNEHIDERGSGNGRIVLNIQVGTGSVEVKRG